VCALGGREFDHGRMGAERMSVELRHGDVTEPEENRETRQPRTWDGPVIQPGYEWAEEDHRVHKWERGFELDHEYEPGDRR
jgi:hypothetical protein